MFMLGSDFEDATPVVPAESDLQAAVARSSMPAVYTILTIWQSSPEMLDESGAISPRWTTSALMIAVEKARSDIVSLLLAVSNDDKLPVLDALRVGSIRNFEAFLWNGWDINEPVKMDGPPALGYAMHSKELVVWFLEQGADPNAGYEYDTALSRAALSGTTEMINMLLSHGGDVRRGDVLNWAVEREDDACEITKLLLERGAQPNRLRFDGQEPQWSVFGMRDGLGTPLHRAIILGRADLVTVLLAHGADSDIKNTKGKTASQLALESGKPEIMKLLDEFHA